MQAGRPAQPSAADSPSSSHPRKGFCEASTLSASFAARPPGSPRKGCPGRLISMSRGGSAPRERDHRGGDHPVPSRTRQLSPPSPRVLQRQAAGGQGVALAEGAFLLRGRPRRPAGPAGGPDPPAGPSCVLGHVRANDPLSRLRRWYLRTAPLCASCRGWCKAPQACWGMRQAGASNLLLFIPWLFSAIFF